MNGKQPEEPVIITLSSDEDEEKEEAQKTTSNTKEKEAESACERSFISIASTSREYENTVRSSSSICSRASGSSDDTHDGLQAADCVFENFLALCAKCLRLPEDQPILDKLKKFHKSLDLDYRGSREFKQLLKKKSEEVLPSNIYEKLKPVMALLKENKAREDSGNEETKRETRKRLWIARLEDLLERLDKKIKEISEMEVDLDVDDDSTYILEDKLKRKFVRTYRELCRLRGERHPPSSSHLKISYHGTRHHEINKYLSKYVSHLKEPPDFQDILTAISEAADKFHIDLSESERYRTAREAFPAIMSMIQKSRVKDFLDTFGTHTTDAVDVAAADPALSDEQLKSKLHENSAAAKTRLDEVFEKYERLQEEKTQNGELHENEGQEEVDKSEEEEETDELQENGEETDELQENGEETDELEQNGGETEELGEPDATGNTSTNGSSYGIHIV